ncbi:MAG: membrane lipoprotein lipid attachment site-containing protein [Ruminococcus sp.]|nr:membrane lipoprotein lipid attachment site-containing protein [Ruminococcus sp.]
MKKLILTLTAVLMLTGCSEKNAASSETPKNETSERSEVTVHVETGTAIVNTETVIETTATETTTSAVTTAEAVTETETTTEEYESEIYTNKIEKVPSEEQAALEKLNAKYGKEFKFICRDVQWEFWDTPIPEKRPTTYTLEDDEGRRFCAYGTEDSDEIRSDEYVFPLFEDELIENAKNYIRSYTQAGKLWLPTINRRTMPFEAPAEPTYEEFFSYFCNQEGKISAFVFLPEGTELPTELSVFDNMNYLYLDDFGCQVVLYVYYLPQKDYDRLDDVVYGNGNINREHMREANR